MAEIINRIKRIIKVKQWVWKKNEVTKNHVIPLIVILFLLGVIIAFVWFVWSFAGSLASTIDSTITAPMNPSTNASGAIVDVQNILSLFPIFIICSFLFGFVRVAINSICRDKL